MAIINFLPTFRFAKFSISLICFLLTSLTLISRSLENIYNITNEMFFECLIKNPISTQSELKYRKPIQNRKQNLSSFLTKSQERRILSSF